MRFHQTVRPNLGPSIPLSSEATFNEFAAAIGTKEAFYNEQVDAIFSIASFRSLLIPLTVINATQIALNTNSSLFFDFSFSVDVNKNNCRCAICHAVVQSSIMICQMNGQHAK